MNTVGWRQAIAMGFAVFATVCGPRAVYGQSAEIIRGTVTDSALRPIPDASVVVSATGTTTQRTTTTDDAGRFGVLFGSEYRQYTIVVRKIGFAVELRPLSRSGLSNVLSVSVILRRSAVTLAPLTATAPRLTTQSGIERPSIGGEATSALNNRDFLGDPSNIGSLTALVPGLFSTDSGVSAVGAPTDQNSTVLDGLPFSDINLPPDAICGASVATTTSDPARGGFAGAQTALSSCRGNDYFESTLRGTLNDPALAWTDQASLLEPPRVATVSGYISGRLPHGAGHYHWSFFGNGLSLESPSLLTLNQAQLTNFGLAPDTVTALRSALDRLGVPLSSEISHLSSQQLNTALTADWSIGAATTLLLVADGNLRSTHGQGIGALSYPSVATDNTGSSGRVMVQGSRAIGSLLNNLSVVWTETSSRTRPVLANPGASVLVSAGSDSSGLRQVDFGGGRLWGSSTTTIWNVQNEASWFAGGGVHQLRFGQEFDLTSEAVQSAYDSSGTYQYESVDDVASNLPFSYIRFPSVPTIRLHTVSGAMWVADIARASHRLSFEGGLRLEGTRVGDAQLDNQVLDSVFRIRSNRTPAFFSLSPRLGFALLLRQEPIHHFVEHGDTIPVIYLDNDQFSPQAPRGNAGAGTTLYGNLGAYRGAVSPRTLTTLSSGEEGDTRAGLTCVGSATPTPDWTVPAVPTSCVGGNQVSPFGASFIQAAVLSNNFHPPTDWKLNLGLTGINWWNTWTAFSSLVLKHGEDYSSWTDRNLQTMAQFQLANEAGRPVYGDPQSITSVGGQFAPSANRVLTQFGQVREFQSDLTSDALQFNASVWTGPIIVPRLRFIVQYWLNLQRRQFSGFDGTTAGNPYSIESEVGTQPIHEFAVTTPTGRIGGFVANVRFDLQSGIAYTPLVVGDINGDGLQNDRAFVPDPEGNGDPTVRAQMHSLLSAAPASARQCLASQVDQIARANSCRGPWHFRFDVTLKYEPQRGFGPGGGLHIIAQVFNIGGAFARLFGATGALAQSQLPPDNRLLFMTGFDPGTSAFRYQVNPDFGRPLDAGSTSHQYEPVQLQVGLEYHFGGPPAQPLLQSLGLRPSQHKSYTAEQVANALRRLRRNPIDTLLGVADSLLLSAPQIDTIRGIANIFQLQADSIIDPLVRFVLRRGARLTDPDFLDEEGPILRRLNPLRNNALERALAALNQAQRIKWNSMMGSHRFQDGS